MFVLSVAICGITYKEVILFYLRHFYLADISIEESRHPAANYEAGLLNKAKNSYIYASFFQISIY